MKITKDHIFSRYTEVYLNGQKVGYGIEADEEAGTVTRYCTAGTPPTVVVGPDGKTPKTETLKGKVEIRVRENAEGVTRYMLEEIARWGDIYTATARMFGERFVQADDNARKAMQVEAMARQLHLDRFGVVADRLRQLVKDAEVKMADPAELDSFCGVDRDRPGGLSCTLPKGHDGPHFRPHPDSKRVEVCATSFVLVAVADVINDEVKIKCRRCDRPIRKDECAWHDGADLSTDWTCCTCVPVVNGQPAPGAVLTSEPRFLGKLPEQAELLVQPTTEPADLLRKLHDLAVTPEAKLLVKVSSTTPTQGTCAHCGGLVLAVPGSTCIVCGKRLCVVCRTKPTASHECPVQRASYKMEAMSSTSGHAEDPSMSDNNAGLRRELRRLRTQHETAEAAKEAVRDWYARKPWRCRHGYLTCSICDWDRRYYAKETDAMTVWDRRGPAAIDTPPVPAPARVVPPKGKFPIHPNGLKNPAADPVFPVFREQELPAEKWCRLNGWHNGAGVDCSTDPAERDRLMDEFRALDETTHLAGKILWRDRIMRGCDPATGVPSAEYANIAKSMREQDARKRGVCRHCGVTTYALTSALDLNVCPICWNMKGLR